MKTEILGCLEQKIMDILWTAQEPLKPGDVLKKLKGDYAYTTIMTVLKRLSDKNFLKREMKGKVYYYSPLKEKNQFIGSNLSDIFKNLVNSYGKLAISQFVDTVKDNKEDIEMLKQYLKKNAQN